LKVIFAAPQEGVALTFMWLLQIFIYCVICNLLHVPVPWLHAPNGHKAAPPELPKQRRRRCRPWGNLEVHWLPPSHPGQTSFYRAGTDGAEEDSALLPTANAAEQAACYILHWF